MASKSSRIASSRCPRRDAETRIKEEDAKGDLE